MCLMEQFVEQCSRGFPCMDSGGVFFKEGGKNKKYHMVM